jgi:hypothetical protein
MMRAFFITACVLSLIYIIACAGIAEMVSDARWSYDYTDYYGSDYYGDDYGYDSYDYGYDDYYNDDADDYTRVGGVVSVFYMLISAGAFLLALMKIKTKTMKVISIIGLSLSGLFLLWAMLPMASPSGISFDEIAPAFILAGITLLALHIVGIVHAFKTST